MTWTANETKDFFHLFSVLMRAKDSIMLRAMTRKAAKS